jgi:hypothetical protein
MLCVFQAIILFVTLQTHYCFVFVAMNADGSDDAGTRRFPTRSVFCVEVPLLVTNPDAAIKLLGGLDAIGMAASQVRDAKVVDLNLRLRESVSARPLQPERVQAFGGLLRLNGPAGPELEACHSDIITFKGLLSHPP